jgi:hypothetical protein
MNTKPINQSKNSHVGFVLRIGVAAVSLLLLGIAVAAQDITPAPTPVPALQPAIHDLRGASIDMTLEEVKEKLGKPKITDKTGLFYEFSKGETAQIGIDEKKKVRTIALIFASDSSNIPSYAEVFGPDVPLVPKQDGSIYKMVRYPKSGYWIAYSRSAGKQPITIITMRRIIKQ